MGITPDSVVFKDPRFDDESIDPWASTEKQS